MSKIPEKVKDWLRKNNFEYLTFGENSIVYEHSEDNIVAKIMLNEDKCWKKFIDIAKKYYKRNPAFPITNNVFNIEGYDVCIMETLDRISIDRASSIIECMMVYIYYHNDELKIFDNDLIEDINLDYEEHEKIDMYNTFINQHYYLRDMVHILNNENAFKECSLDLNPSNIMQRKHGNIVVVDILFKP